jgi:hypothetical protein
MPVIPVNKVVNKKRIIGNRRVEERQKGSLTSKNKTYAPARMTK